MTREARCGRLDCAESHLWTRPALLPRGPHPAETFRCNGSITTEGGHRCTTCQEPTARCGCRAELAEERRREWDQ